VSYKGDGSHLVAYCHFTLHGYPEASGFWTAAPNWPIAFLVYIYGNGLVHATSRVWDTGVVEN
jgi:hypothetical protein